MNMLHGFSDNKYEFLSNFSACEIFYANDVDPEGWHYKTSEHAFQAAKAYSPQEMHWIAAATTPGEAKRKGRNVRLRKDWEEIKDQVMLDILRIKFKDPDMRARMMGTIVDGIDGFCEDNWWHDNYWGDCQCEKCKNIPGQNKLGKLLMQIREEIVSDILNVSTKESEK